MYTFLVGSSSYINISFKKIPYLDLFLLGNIIIKPLYMLIIVNMCFLIIKMNYIILMLCMYKYYKGNIKMKQSKIILNL